MKNEEMNDTNEIIKIARAIYESYANKNRAANENLPAADFHFTSPINNRLDRVRQRAR